MKRKTKNSIEISPFFLHLPLFPKGTFQKKGGRFLLEAFTPRPTTLTIEDILEDGERRESWISKRGPKYPSGEILPSYIVGAVDTLVEKGKAKNIHDAFPEIAEITGYASDDCIKKIYYTALKRDMYRNLVDWIEPSQPFYLESLIASIKECVGKGWIWEPQNLKETMTRLTEIYGEEKKREVMSVYIEELEKLLTVETYNETIIAAKKWWSGLRVKVLPSPSS